MKNRANSDLDMWIRKIAKRDYHALEELYRELNNAVFRFALMILKDRNLAEDAMQESFMKIMSRAGSYRPHSNPRAWIFTIVRNTCFDILKKRKETLTMDADVLNAIPDDQLKEDLAESMVESMTVREAVNNLTSVEKDILSLYVFGELQQTEIAKIIGISYMQVRSHYGYAIKKLRKELGKYYENHERERNHM